MLAMITSAGATDITWTDKTTGDTYTADNVNETKAAVNSKQDTLVSGTNIKTINSVSVLGSGDITISGAGTTTALSVGTVGATTVGITTENAADDVVIPAATNAAAGVVTAAQVTAIEANTAKVSSSVVQTVDPTGTGTMTDVSSEAAVGDAFAALDSKNWVFTGSVDMSSAASVSMGQLSFEGATIDDNETTFSITDPTADRVINTIDADMRIPAASQVNLDGTLIVSGGTAPTIQAADPTASSATGYYGATTSGDFFYKSSDGLFNFAAGTYVIDPTTYTLAIDMIDGNGTDKFTYSSTDYTTDQTFTGLTTDASFTVTADTGREVSCTGTGLTDNTGGSYTANTDSANVTADCTYSVSGGYGTTIFSYNFNVADNSDPTSVGAPTDVFFLEYDNNGEGNILSNEYVASVNDNDSVELRRTVTPAEKLELSFKLKLSTLAIQTDPGNKCVLATLRNPPGGGATLYFFTSSGTDLDQFLVSYTTDAGTTYVYTDVALTANTWVDVILRYESATADGDNDGVVYASVNGVEVVNLSNLDNDTVGDVNEPRLGSGYGTHKTTYSLYVDDVEVKTP
jgi:hypothetical protein